MIKLSDTQVEDLIKQQKTSVLKGNNYILDPYEYLQKKKKRKLSKFDMETNDLTDNEESEEEEDDEEEEQEEEEEDLIQEQQSKQEDEEDISTVEIEDVHTNTKYNVPSKLTNEMTNLLADLVSIK